MISPVHVAGRVVRERPGSVAVVIPCHNYGRFLRDAVSSAMEQSHPPDIVIVIDDGSRDETAAVLRDLTRKYHDLMVITHLDARGLSETRNVGGRVANCEFMMFLDADDKIPPDYIEHTRRALLVSAADFAYTPILFFGDRDGYKSAPLFDRRELAYRNYVHSAALFRRSLLHETQFSNALNVLGGEDWGFWLAAVRDGGEGVYCSTTHLAYRRHGGGSMNSAGESYVSFLRLHLALHREFPEVVPLATVVRRALVRLPVLAPTRMRRLFLNIDKKRSRG